MSGVLVSAYGGIDWSRRMASGLAKAGLLDRYVTSVILTSRAEQAIEQRLPDPVSQRILRQLRLRPQPADVPTEHLARVGTIAELVKVGALRASVPDGVIHRLRRRFSRQFDSGVARMLTGTELGVIGYVSASRETFGRARELGVRTVLDYPIAHHRYSERLLQEEARLQPEFASTLQIQPERLAGRIDEEIDQADCVLMLSSFQRRTFVESGVPEEKLATIPLGVDLDLFRPEAGASDRFRVLFVGQVTQRKGISYLFEGFEMAALSDAELVLRGRGVGPIDRWTTGANVHHLPPVPALELPAEYASADVFVLPSLIEGFPRTAIQAMACGLPVIVSENTFGEDVVTDGVDGYVVPIRDANAVADRLQRLQADPDLRERMGRAARERALEFSWENYERRLVEIVRDVTGVEA